VQETSTLSARLHEAIPSSYRRIGLWCGSNTLAGGRVNVHSHPHKTQITHSCLLLSHVYRNRMELQHLRSRTISYYKSHYTLATISNLNSVPIHNIYRPCKPTILEIPKETQLMHSKIAFRAQRLPLHHPALPRQTPYGSRLLVQTTRF
jgi:hypothetical protein